MALKTWSIGAVVCLLAGSASAATTVPAGNVSGTWSALSSPYHVLGNVTVPVGQTLTVDADVVVKFESGMGMTVNGTLSVIGASGQGVTFTSKLDDSVGDDWDGTAGTNGAPGDWTGIFVNTSNSGGVSLSYATIRYGGGGVAGCTTCANLRVNDPTGGSIGPATITNSVIEHSAYAGIYGQNEYLITLSSSTIRNNGTYGVRVAASNVNLAATGSSFDDNGNWAIDRVGLSDIQNIANNSFSHTDGTARFLGVGVTGETLSAARTWPGSNVALVTDPAEPTGPRLAVGAPFVLFSDAAVNGNATITIEAGAVFKLAPGVQIYPYDAVVNANGTEASPIVFTALKDDSVSGDTNADGATAVGAGDYWDRWLFNNDNNGTYPANGTFNYTVFRYGGNTSGLIYARFYPTYLTFNHCTFEYSKTSAFSFSDADGQGSDKRVVINDSLVRNNALYGINAGAEQGRLAVQGTTFSDNGSFAMYGLDVNRLTFLGRLPSGDSSYQAPNVFQNQTVSAGKNLAMVVTGGTSVASGTWPSDGVILIRNQATMAGNCVVSVDPGAVIKFWDAAASLYPYDATLNVNGACPQDGAGNPQPDACLDPATGKDQRVYFTSLKDDVGGDTNGDGGASQPAPGDWLSINFNNDNNASYPANATFSHAVLRYGGAANGMVQTRYLPTNLNFYDSTFASSATAAIYDDGSTDGGSGRLSVQGCRFRDNLGYAVENLHVNRLRYMGRVPAGDGGYSAPNVFLNGDGTTGKQAVAVTRGTAWSNGVWGNDGVIVVRNQPAINNNATITVEPGTVIKFWNTGASLYPYDVTFNVNGACPLDAGGNPQPDTCLDPATGKDQRVYFTSLKDDSVGGDTNGDGATTAAAPGDWDRVYFNNDNTVGYPANGTLRYAVFRYGGFGGGANVEARYYPTYLTFDHCTFERSANAGLSFSAMDGATNEKRIAIYDSVFRDNAGRGIDFVSPARMTIQGSTFSDNGGWAMYGQELNRLIFMGRLPPGDSSYQAANVFVNSDGSTDRLANVIVDG
ncbi:MAG: right-handed parallel beta-helix repeat-containing protein, partial [Deltaproteobacteria bacterium]|nr:right-handed parallel beta-helix repeat-containing protein [Deltaproteobacteria bacterium]